MCRFEKQILVPLKHFNMEKFNKDEGYTINMESSIQDGNNITVVIQSIEILKNDHAVFCQCQEAINVDYGIKNANEWNLEEKFVESLEHFNFMKKDQDWKNNHELMINENSLV